MRNLIGVAAVLLTLHASAQDSTMNSLTTDMDKPASEKKKVVRIFESERLINANTTEVVGRGKMDFKVTHNFEDIAGDNGGIRNFFGLDNSTDIRIGFHVGLTDRLTFSAARAKGGGPTKTYLSQLYEVGLKYQLMRQLENDPSHPISVTLFASNVISTRGSGFDPPRDLAGNTTDTALNYPYAFQDFGDRMGQVVQAIIAKKINKVSLLLNFTVVHQGYVPLHDQQTIAAVGGAIRLPLGKSVNLIVDYFHPFRSKASRDYFKSTDFTFNPPNDIDKNNVALKFYDPLGIGFEIITAGHVFHLNFTNSIEILESRFIPYTSRSWGKGEFRWGFNLSRIFALWRTN